MVVGVEMLAALATSTVLTANVATVHGVETRQVCRMQEEEVGTARAI